MQINVPLLSGASATGAANTIQLGGDFCFDVAGTFGGASVGLEMLGPDNVTWIAVRDTAGAVAFTAAGAVIVSIPAGTYRATITGGSGVSLSARLRSVMQ
jgi:hypothetical protein